MQVGAVKSRYPGTDTRHVWDSHDAQPDTATGHRPFILLLPFAEVSSTPHPVADPGAPTMTQCLRLIRDTS